jgi:hypothetical protein
MVDLPNSMPMYAQIASAKGLFEEPLKIFTIDYISFEQKPTGGGEKAAGTVAAKCGGARVFRRENRLRERGGKRAEVYAKARV